MTAPRDGTTGGKASLTSGAPLRAARNTFLLVVVRVIMPLLGVALVLVLTRILGAEALGRFTLAYGFLTVFNSIAPLGLNMVITRDGARDRGALDATLRNALGTCTAAAVGLSVVMAGAALLLDYDGGSRNAILVLSLAVLPCTVGMLLDGACMALERVDQIAIGIVVEYVIKLGGGLLALLLGFGLDLVLLMAVVGKLAACVVQVVLLRRLGVKVAWAAEREAVRALIALVPTFLGISVFSTLYWKIDVFMLSTLRPVADVGYYGAAYKILELAMVFPQSVCLSLYPQIAAASHRDVTALKTLGRSALRFLLVVSLPLAVCATILARPGLTFLYGPGFQVASATLGVLIFTLVPYCLVRYHAYVLVAANHQRVDLTLNIVMALVNVVLNVVLIPRYTHLGAAMATLCAILTYAIMQVLYLRRRLPGHGAPVPPLAALLLVTVLTAATTWLLRDQALFLAIAAGCLVYLVSVLWGGFFTPEEWRLLHLDGLMRRLRVTRPGT